MYMYYFADKNHSLKKKRKKVICGGNEKNITVLHQTYIEGFTGSAVVKNPPANAGDKDSSPGLGRSHMPRSN